MTPPVCAFWRRLDRPGHDACWLERHEGGWRLTGACVFQGEAAAPTALRYRVDCDADWQTHAGHVEGRVGSQAVEARVERSAGRWRLNGAVIPGLEDLLDLDLSVTPATNILHLRRVGLAVGDTADIPVAWLDVEAGALGRLSQTYTRQSEHRYWYEAPSVGYRGLLEMASTGFVSRYPGLWDTV